MAEVLAWSFSQIDNIRIDTHRDNKPMRHLLEKYGFTYCGIIYLLNGDERLYCREGTGCYSIRRPVCMAYAFSVFSVTSV